MPKPKSKKKKIDKTQARQAGLLLLSDITNALYTLKDMVRKGEVCGVGQGDIEDTITIVGKISNRISMYSW
jgi:hypothetical protein